MPSALRSLQSSSPIAIIVTPSGPTGQPARMEGAGFQVFEEDIIRIAYIRPLPGLHHHPNVGMVSLASMNQEQYERNIMAMG